MKWFRLKSDNNQFHWGYMSPDTVYIMCEEIILDLPANVIDMVEEIECNKKCKSCYNKWYDARNKELERKNGRQ